MKLTFKSLILFFFLIAIDFLIAGGLSELWVRIFVPVDNTCYTHNSSLGDQFCPDQTSYGYVEKGYSNIFKSNSAGFHDREHKKEKGQNTIRFQVYGDSITTAEGVTIQNTIPSLLEKYLQSNSELKSRIEVMNMAPAEDSTVAQYLTFKEYGADYSPDVVICWFMSDFQDNIFETHKRTRSPYLTLTENNELSLSPPTYVHKNDIISYLKSSSMLVRLLANKYLASQFFTDILHMKDKIMAFGLKKTPPVIPSTKTSSSNILAEKSYPLTMRILQEFKRNSNQIGATFVLIDGIRFRDSISSFYTNDDLKIFCQKNDILYIPVFNEYHSLRDNDITGKFFFKDGHPTKYGNAVLAKASGKKLIQSFSQLGLD